MTEEKKQGLVVGAITFVIVVLTFLAMGNSPDSVAPAPANEESGYWLVGVAALVIIGGSAYLYTQSDFNIKVSRPRITDGLTEVKGEIEEWEYEEYRKQIASLFGTHNVEEIGKAIRTMYQELEERRSQPNQSKIIDKLIQEREQVQALADRWQAKAVQQNSEIKSQAELLDQRRDWQPVSEEDLSDFWATVQIDGDAFLGSKRRQRRLLQRLRAEGLMIMKSQAI